MNNHSSESQQTLPNEVQEATLHFQSSPFQPTNLTIQFKDKFLKLKTKGVSTIRKSVMLDGIVASIQDVTTMVEQAHEVTSEHTEEDYLLHFFDCQKQNLGYIRAKMKEEIPRQEIDFHLKEN